jgi:hypothetical protein
VSRSDRNKELSMNRPERRSPIRRVGVRPQDRAGSETGAPIARFMAGEQVQLEQGPSHKPRTLVGAQVLTKICHYSRPAVGTSCYDVRDGQRSAGPPQCPQSSDTPELRCVSETAQRAVPTTGRKPALSAA